MLPLEFSEEDPADYRYGGYHPAQIGEILNSRYLVKKKLGWGHFSTVWYCLDMFAFSFLVSDLPSLHHRKQNRGVAIKIVRSNQNYTNAARAEIALLTQITRFDPDNKFCVCHLLDYFMISGPNGHRLFFLLRTAVTPISLHSRYVYGF